MNPCKTPTPKRRPHPGELDHPPRRRTGLNPPLRVTIILALSTLLISACGNRGALYLPDEEAMAATNPAPNDVASDREIAGQEVTGSNDNGLDGAAPDEVDGETPEENEPDTDRDRR